MSETETYFVTCFVCPMDWITKKALIGTDVGLEWTYDSKLCDLEYADDIVLLDSSHDRRQRMTVAVEHEKKEGRTNYEPKETQAYGIQYLGKQ